MSHTENTQKTGISAQILVSAEQTNGGYMVGCLAVSKAGHDKDEIYLILKEEKDFVYLADGIGKTTSTPKKKNKKHIQIIKNGLHEIPVEEVRGKLESGQPVMDEEIKYVLKQYKKKNQKFTG